MDRRQEDSVKARLTAQSLCERFYAIPATNHQHQSQNLQTLEVTMTDLDDQSQLEPQIDQQPNWHVPIDDDQETGQQLTSSPTRCRR